MSPVPDYTGPYDTAIDPQYQLVAQVLALSALPAQVLTIADVVAVSLPLPARALNWIVYGGSNQLGGVGILYGVATWDLTNLAETAQIVGIALIGGQSGDELVSIAAVDPPLTVQSSMGSISMPVTLVTVDSLE